MLDAGYWILDAGVKDHPFRYFPEFGIQHPAALL
jgi:hypothetical protein